MNGCMIKVPLKRLLRERDRSVYSLAKETNVAYTTLWKLETGRSQSISFDVLEKLCTALDCTPNDILQIVPDKKKASKK
jgi:putative transcriptional regulator